MGKKKREIKDMAWQATTERRLNNYLHSYIKERSILTKYWRAVLLQEPRSFEGRNGSTKHTHTHTHTEHCNNI